jgi:trimeric autotransporter adhesin
LALAGGVNLLAGGNIVIDGDTAAGASSIGSGVSATAGGDIFIKGKGAIGAHGMGSNVTLTTGANRFLVLSSEQPFAAVHSQYGDVTINADRVGIANTAIIFTESPGHSVTIQPVSAAWAVDLGSATNVAASALELWDAELDHISTGTLRIGSTSSTGITISSQITADGHYDTLSLRTGGAIVDGTAGQQTDITVNNLALHAATGIGSSDFLDVAVSNLAFNNSGAGNVAVSNAAGLTLAAVDGLASSSDTGGGALVFTSGALTAATNVTASGVLFLVALDTAAAGDNLTVLPGVAIQSAGDSVRLAGGDDVVVQAGASVQSTGTLFAIVDANNADGGGGTANLNGTFVAPDTRIIGGFDNDTLNGTPLVDLLDGNFGADIMRGGGGNDTYIVDDGSDAVFENVGDGTDTVRSFVHFVLPANVENLILEVGSGDLQGYGNGLPNTITGNEGSNLLDGRGGPDVLIGQDGNDLYVVDDAGDVVIETSASGGNDVVFASAHFALSANVETLILEGTANLQGYGNDLANTLYGNVGNNLLDGRGAADGMRGDAGNDTYFVDDAGDQAIENAGEGNDAVFSTAHFALSANVETLVLQGIADLQGYGNTFANLLYGNGGHNLLDGRGGPDIMLGGFGNDTYFVDNIGEMIVENLNEGTDAVFATVDHILAANVETLVLQGSVNLSGTGNAIVNNIYGNSGDNTLNGGGAGDLLTGNAGNDTFVFNVGQGDGDTVADFAGNGAAVGDSLRFVGYGAGATFTQNDATHWQVNYNSGASHEVITFMNGASIHPTDVVFA